MISIRRQSPSKYFIIFGGEDIVYDFSNKEINCVVCSPIKTLRELGSERRETADPDDISG